MPEWECVYPGKPYRYWQHRDITVAWDGDDVAVEFDNERFGVYIPPHVLRDSLPPEPLSLRDAMFECRGVGADVAVTDSEGLDLACFSGAVFSRTPIRECTAADATGAA